MPLTLAEKQAIVAEVAEVARQAQSALAAEYRGLKVAEMTELRNRAKDAGLWIRVVRNTLTRRAVEGTQFECLKEGLTGPLVLTFSLDDPGAPARVARDFARTHDKLKVRLIAFGGKLIDPANLDQVANMPTREQALATLAMVMKAPIVKLVRTIAEPHARLVRVLDAIRRQKEANQ